MVTPSEIREKLVSFGWVIDRHGHAQRLITRRDGKMRQYRVKIQDRSVRLEGKLGTNKWFKLDGAFYGQVEVTDNAVKIGRYNVRPLPGQKEEWK